MSAGPPATALGFNPPARDIMRQRPRSRLEPLFTSTLVWRFLASGSYVALATIGSFVWWFLDQGVGLRDLMRWEQCTPAGAVLGAQASSPLCSLLSGASGLAPPQSMALTVLVLLELLKALSAVSLDTSLLQAPPWGNPALLLGTLAPLLGHLLFMYVPLLAGALRLHPLSLREWKVSAVVTSLYNSLLDV